MKIEYLKRDIRRHPSKCNFSIFNLLANGNNCNCCKVDFSINRCKSVAKILWRIIITWLAPINKGFLTTSKPNTTIRTRFCILLNPYNIYIIWSFTQLLPVLFYIPNLFRIFCTHFGVTVSTY